MTIFSGRTLGHALAAVVLSSIVACGGTSSLGGSNGGPGGGPVGPNNPGNPAPKGPVPIGPDNSGDAQRPQVAFEAQGNATVIWEQREAASHSIWSTRQTVNGAW